MRTAMKIVAVALVVLALLGGFDFVADVGSEPAGDDAQSFAPTLGIVEPVAADTCPNGHSGC